MFKIKIILYVYIKNAINVPNAMYSLHCCVQFFDVSSNGLNFVMRQCEEKLMEYIKVEICA